MERMRDDFLMLSIKSRRELAKFATTMAGDEGFEPPQTESESGVLPLHKSPKKVLRRNASIIIQACGHLSSVNFKNCGKNRQGDVSRRGKAIPTVCDAAVAGAAAGKSGKGKPLVFANAAAE